MVFSRVCVFNFPARNRTKLLESIKSLNIVVFGENYYNKAFSFRLICNMDLSFLQVILMGL